MVSRALFIWVGGRVFVPVIRFTSVVRKTTLASFPEFGRSRLFYFPEWGFNAKAQGHSTASRSQKESLGQNFANNADFFEIALQRIARRLRLRLFVTVISSPRFARYAES